MSRATKTGTVAANQGLTVYMSESALRVEIDVMAESYYNYLTLPLNSAKIINYDIVSFYKTELIGVDTLLTKGGNFRPFADGLPNLIPFQPKVGQRGLPKLFRGEVLSKLYKFVILEKDFDLWKSKGFDILLQIQIAQ